MKITALALLSASGLAAAADITLEDFSAPVHSWRQVNDPVMGGQSTGTFEIVDGVGVFDGEVVDVPSLSAPGFIKVQTQDSVAYPDISACTMLGIQSKNLDEYTGYRLSVGNERPPVGTGGGFFTAGHKAPFTVDGSNTATIPFEALSTAWSDATGDIITECADDERVCITAEILQNIGRIEVWGEGRGGAVHLEIEKIFASGCPESTVSATAVVTEVGTLANFDGAHSWYALNDPVMGGQSTSNLEIVGNEAIMNGTVAIVPALSAPGFVVLQSSNGATEEFENLSGSSHLEIKVRSFVDYPGFKISVAADTFNWQFASFKANFDLVSNGELETVMIPWSAFSNEWNGATGESTCPADKDCTPADDQLDRISNVGFWLEGSEGDFEVEVVSIKGVLVVE